MANASIIVDPELQSAASTLSIGDYFGVFTRRAWLIVIPFLVVLVIGAVLAFLLPAQYTSVTVTEVEDMSGINKLYTGLDYPIEVKPELLNFRPEILRRSFLEDLVDKCGIQEGFNTSDQRERARLFEQIITTRLKVKLATAKEGQGADILEISYTGRDPRRVARFVNEVRDKYQRKVLGGLRDKFKKALSELEGRLKAAEDVYAAATNDYQRFLRENDFQLVGGEGVISSKQNELGKHRENLNRLKTGQARLEREADELRIQLNQTEKLVVGPSGRARNPEYDRRLAAIEDLEGKLRDRMVTLTPTNPLLKPLIAEIAKARDALSAVQEFADGGGETGISQVWLDLDAKVRLKVAELEGHRQEVLALQGLIATMEEVVKTIPERSAKEQRLFQVRREAQEQLAKVAQLVLKARGTVDRLSAPEAGVFQALRQPLPEQEEKNDPVFPNVPLFIGVAGFVGLLFGTGLAFMKEFTSSSFVTVNQVRRTLPVAVLGHVGVIRTPTEDRVRRRKRFVVLGLVLAVVGALVWSHLCYFRSDLRQNLPPWLFSNMKRVYGDQGK